MELLPCPSLYLHRNARGARDNVGNVGGGDTVAQHFVLIGLSVQAGNTGKAVDLLARAQILCLPYPSPDVPFAGQLFLQLRNDTVSELARPGLIKYHMNQNSWR